MVTEQITQLKKLQEVLVKKNSVKNKIDDIPKNIIIKKDLLDRMKERYQNNSEIHKKKQQELARFRMELEQNEANREKLEEQIENVDTQRGYEALEKEIRERSDRESVIREHQEILRNDIKQLEESVEQEHLLTQEQQLELEQEEQKMNTQMEVLHADLTGLEAEESEVSAGFNTEFLFKFQRIINTTGGKGIVPLKSVVCSGCHMILPTHTANEVRREKEILFCPYCSKVLYHESDEATANENNANKGSDADIVKEFEGALGDGITFDDIFDNKDRDDPFEEDEIAEKDDEDIEEGEDTVEEEEGEYSGSHYEEVGVDETHTEDEDVDNESYVEYGDEDFSFDDAH